MKNFSRSVFVSCACLSFSSMAMSAEKTPAAPQPLAWRKISWPSLDYARVPVEGGAGVYTIPENGARKFRLAFVFAHGIFNFPKELVSDVNAVADHLIMGGAGKRTYEDITNFVTENGLTLNSSLNGQGNLVVSVEGLSVDFSKALNLVSDVLLTPRFEKKSFDLWREEKNDDFASLLDGGSPAKQSRFMNLAINRISLGQDHYLTRTLWRMSPASLSKVNHAGFSKVASQLIVRAGLNVVLSGGFSAKDASAVSALVRKIPTGDVRPTLWLAERPNANLVAQTSKVRVVIVQKPDMAQASAELRILLPSAGEINSLETIDVVLANDVFSSSAGVVGNDRWTRAMRADSGLSYSPSAHFVSELLEPNTNVGAWRLMFQSPLNRVEEACTIAKKTWDEFAIKGVAASEFQKARVVTMNSRLSREETVFDKAAAFERSLAKGDLPNPVREQVVLASLDAAQNGHERANKTLERLAATQSASYMVIMGNISSEQVQKIAALPGFEVSEVIGFDALVKQIQ